MRTRVLISAVGSRGDVQPLLRVGEGLRVRGHEVHVFANPAFGSVSVTDVNALRPAGSSWTVPGSVTANAAPAAGRVLLGNVQVRTDTNVLVGSGDVVVQSVTP